MSNIAELIVAMLDDCGGSYFLKDNYIRNCMMYLRIDKEEVFNKFVKVMRKSEYVKYLDVEKFNFGKGEVYFIHLNELGKKERNIIENLLKLKGLLK